MHIIKSGFAMVDITPPLGVCMAGYYSRREAKGVLDPLYASALSISSDDGKWILIGCDLIGIGAEYIKDIKRSISKKTGFDESSIMINCTHTHTGPHVRKSGGGQRTKKLGGPDEAYIEMLIRKLSDAALMSIDSQKESKIETGKGLEYDISFIRRFLMKDGSVKTNPGIGNPDIIKPVGNIIPDVNVLSIKQENGKNILVVNFALHPDITGGEYFSADYPGHLRTALKAFDPELEVLYINGAAGDINHIDAMNPGMTSKGFEYSQKVGRVLAGEVIKICQRLKPLESFTAVKTAAASACTVKVPLRKITEDEKLPAQKLVDSFHAGLWDTKSMSDVADLAGAYQTLNLAEKGDYIELELQAVSIGDIVYQGVPGELFSDIGRRIAGVSPFKQTYISALTNGSAGYFPTKEAFTEGGYESKNNPFTSELEDILVNSAEKLLKELYKGEQ